MHLRPIITLLRQKGYTIFERPHQLNIVGVRSKDTLANRFDDTLRVFYKDENGKWQYHWFLATTDPGTYWLNNPLNEQGTAILKEGQYVNGYQLGLHQGKYTALVQRKPVTVIRDYDRNALLDFYNGNEFSGWFGINIHRALSNGTTLYVDKHSAGCQVLQKADDFAFLMKLCEHHRSLYGNSFTYTLVDFRAISRRRWRRTSYAVGSVAALITAYLLLTD